MLSVYSDHIIKLVVSPLDIKKIILFVGAFIFIMNSAIFCYADSNPSEDYQIQENEKEALDHFKEGIKYSEKKELDKALEEYEKAIVLHPDLPELQYNIGRLYGRIGVWDKAIEHLQKYCDLDPGAEDKEMVIVQIGKLQKVVDKKNNLIQKKDIIRKNDLTQEGEIEKYSEDDIELEYDTSYQSPELVWILNETDLTKHTRGPFTVKIRVEGVDEQRYPMIFPRILYYIGTRSSYGYFDMIKEGDGVWSFDIPDPTWYKFRSNSLHYHVELFDEAGSVITESRWEIELIDSFIHKR